MQGGEHQVAGERGFNAHGHGFFVARLADHDDVGVSPQEGAHHEGEVNARLAVDLNLAQAFLRDLDRVFCCPDFGVGLVQVFEDGMQRGGFTGAGGAADVEQAVGLFYRSNHTLFVVRGKA